MTTDHNFLITYGLHNFVSCAQANGKRVFTIKGQTNPKMIRHAKHLIAGNYGPGADIQVA